MIVEAIIDTGLNHGKISGPGQEKAAPCPVFLFLMCGPSTTGTQKINRADSVVAHQHLDTPLVFRDFIDEDFFNIKLDAIGDIEDIFPVVYGFADPTDRPFNDSSSPDDGGAVEYRHDTAPVGDEVDQKMGKLYVLNFFQIHDV